MQGRIMTMVVEQIAPKMLNRSWSLYRKREVMMNTRYKKMVKNLYYRLIFRAISSLLSAECSESSCF
jgi:hypothetical protein